MNARSTLPARADGHGATNGQSRREWYRNEYLQSDHWQQQRTAALERAGHRCQVCNRAQQLDVHHRTYERLGNERREDLTVLCRGCHQLFHGNKRVAPSRATGSGTGGNWSDMSQVERAAFTKRVLDTLSTGPRTARDIAQQLQARPQAVGSCLASCNRRHKVTRHKKTWRLAGTPAPAPTSRKPSKKVTQLERDNAELHAIQQRNKRQQTEQQRVNELLDDWRRAM